MATKAADRGVRTSLAENRAMVAAETITKNESQEVEAYKTKLRDSRAKEEKTVKAAGASKAAWQEAASTSDHAIDRVNSIRRDASKTIESPKKNNNGPEEDTRHSGLVSTLKALKVPMAICTMALAADRVLTYIALGSGFAEVNPLVAGAVSTLGLTGGLVFSGAIVIGAVLAASFLIERYPPLKDRIKRNSVARALFYGIAGTESIGSINNAMTLAHLYPAFNLLGILGPSATIAVLGATMFLPVIISVARQLLNSRKESRGPKEYHDNRLLDAVGNPAATSLQV